MQKLLTFVSAKILVYMPYLIIKVLNDTLTKDIVSFEQLGPENINYTIVKYRVMFYFATRHYRQLQ